jgi:leucyl aminopeptidase
MADGFHPQRTVSFMGYAAEEGGLIGSDEIAAQYLADGIDVVAVLQLDMTDYFGSDEDVGILSDHTDSTLTAFVGQLLDAYQADLVWSLTACGYGCSDHVSWDDRGFPVAMSFESLFGEHNPEIHTVDDTLATLGNNVDHAAKFVRMAVAFMVETAKEGSVDIFADGFESGDTTAWSVTIP